MSGFVRKISTSFSSNPARKETTVCNRGDFLLDPFMVGQTIHAGYSRELLAERLRDMLECEDLTEEAEDVGHPIFCEMMVLKENADLGERYLWSEKSRWIKFEESVEEGARWSKPHISLLSIESLMFLKSTLKSCDSSFDIEIDGYVELIDSITESWAKHFDLPKVEIKLAKSALLARKEHMLKTKLRIGDLAHIESVPNMNTHEVLEATRGGKASAKAQHHALLRKLPKDTEGASILIGYVNGLSHPLAHFVRLKTPTYMKELSELPISIRFLYILLMPHNHPEQNAVEIGICMGTLYVDEIFSKICYKAVDCKDLLYALDEFISQSIIIPAGKWSTSSRLEPVDTAKNVVRTLGKAKTTTLPGGAQQLMGGKKILQRTGRIFGGLVEDLKVKLPWYASDFSDAFRGRFTQTIAATIFLFFANISKIITFGGVMDHVLKRKIGTIENVLAGGICGTIYALFSGQPMCVLSATGPCLVFESIMFLLCESQGWNFLCARFWVGFWTAVVLLIFVAFDLSVMVSWITRFTEEAFASLISLIFLVKALEELYAISETNPVIPELRISLDDPYTFPLNITNHNRFRRSPAHASGNETVNECLLNGGHIVDNACVVNPNVFMFSLVMVFSTAGIAFFFKWFRHSTFFSSKIRNVVADFNVSIAIGAMMLLNSLGSLRVPCLSVPEHLVPTSNRSWLINPLDVDPWWISLVTILPAFFFSILILMDQNITSVIVNRPDNKIRKGFGYHLDLTIIAVLMIVCSTMGIPFYVAATVISLMHLESLRIVSEIAAPGEQPAFLGIREQRITALLAHILIGLSVFLTPVMKLVPMPALLGVFLYMGIVSLIGQQFLQRVAILFMPAKHQPDYPWLRMVPLRKVNVFTIVQLVSFILLAIVEEVKLISMLFPLMLLVLICIRRYVLTRIFTPKELKTLDDELPTWSEVMRVSSDKGTKAFLVDGTQTIQLLPNPQV